LDTGYCPLGAECIAQFACRGKSGNCDPASELSTYRVRLATQKELSKWSSRSLRQQRDGWLISANVGVMEQLHDCGLIDEQEANIT